MRKLKVTKSDIRENYYIIGIGYCGAQYLLSYQDDFAYSSGVNGWSCDYFDIDDVIISTGYSYINNKNTSYSYETLKDYNLKAEKIVHDYNMSYDERKKQVNQLLNDFIKGCKGQ
jgi:hypothetical protein